MLQLCFSSPLKLLRSAEKTVRKIARWENHKRFNVRCSRYKITPTSINMTTNITGVRAQHIVKKAELQLLGVRIRQCTYTIKKLSESLTTDKQQLEAILNSDEMAETEQLLTAAQRHTFEETRSRQQSKFERLYNKCQTKKEVTDTDIDTNRWVMNLSNTQISDDERSILSKGLNFAITPTTLPVEEIIAGTEVVVKYMTETAADELRGEVVCTIKRAKLPKSNISKRKRVALQTLKKDNSIIILPADKGSATVIMNTAKYREKMTNMVGDTNTYTRLSKDPTHKYKNRMINILRKWKRNGSISDKLYWKLYPESEEPPKLYGMPKIHKNRTGTCPQGPESQRISRVGACISTIQCKKTT